MPEWSNGTVSKTVVALKSDPGFESLSLRLRYAETYLRRDTVRQ